MKTTLIISASWLIAFESLKAQNDFNFENVAAQRKIIQESLKTNQVLLAWNAANDSATKGEKFTLLIKEIAGPILDRQWSYPGASAWPLIDWSKVNALKDFMDDQKKVFETKDVIAHDDVELAKVFEALSLTLMMDASAPIWYEDWLLSLAKSSDVNLKRLIFLFASGFGEDMEEETGTTRIVDWNKWETAFNQADNLGKALLLTCMTDLASRNDNYTKLTAMHLSIFEGTNDELKAVALYAGTRSLGATVVGKWQDIADNHPNPKMKTLAQELLNRNSVETP